LYEFQFESCNPWIPNHLMTVLHLYQVKKSDQNEEAAAEESSELKQDEDGNINLQTSGDKETSKWFKSFWRPKASGGCCGGHNRSMWLTVGLFAFAFTFLIFIQNVAGYLAYHGYGVRYDYGIVVNEMRRVGGQIPVALVYRWEHIPWRCKAIEVSTLDDGKGQPMAIYPTEKEVRINDLHGILRQVSFHIPLKSRRDTSLFILTDYSDGGPTRTLDLRTKGRIIKKFGFDSVEIVQNQSLAGTIGGQQFITNIKNFLIKTIESKCESMKV